MHASCSAWTVLKYSLLGSLASLVRGHLNVLLAVKGPCVCSAPQALQIATYSVARAVWCGSGVIVDGKTEWSGAEVADSLVCIAARRYGSIGLSLW